VCRTCLIITQERREEEVKVKVKVKVEAEVEAEVEVKERFLSKPVIEAC